MSKLRLNLQVLEHQEEAVKALSHVFNDVDFLHHDEYSNPDFFNQQAKIDSNIVEVQNGYDGLPLIPASQRTEGDSQILGIDCKMETGTGKTYTMTKFMLDLHDKYGFMKFIILTPSSAIRAGTDSFIKSDYARYHFKELYPNSEIYLHTLEAVSSNKKGRKMLPTEIREYADGSRLDKSRIDVLLMTGAMIGNSRSTLFQNDFEQTLLDDLNCPNDIIAATRPVVIIDEPHRFSKANATYKAIVKNWNPAAIIRFGATFPRTTVGRGKNKQTLLDYDNLVYDLNSARAFNEALVKGVKVQYPAALNEEDTRFTCMSVKNKTLRIRNDATGKAYELFKDDSLSVLHKEFNGVFVEKFYKPEGSSETVALISNGYEIPEKATLTTGTFTASYQQTMLKQALANHFETEWELFQRERKIKPSTLFFIDSIASYRGEDGGNDGWLKKAFERELVLAAEAKMKELKEQEELSETLELYFSFLQATIADVEEVQGGYFAEDNASSDDAIAEKVKIILSEKEKMLNFYNEDGSWNTFRFIFSKWTLREGWDHPNVFQIAKLRSSGSEVSKLQEVGRGLRLPVDEKGSRVSGDEALEFYLTYLVDFNEKEFASNLINEINSDVSVLSNIKDYIKEVAQKRNLTKDQLFGMLLVAGYITSDYEVVREKYPEFVAEYPEFDRGLNKHRVILTCPDDDDNEEDGQSTEGLRRVHLNKKAYQKLAELWMAINAKHIITLAKLDEAMIDECVDNILAADIYVDVERVIVEETSTRKNDGTLEVSKGVKNHFDVKDTIAYNTFLKKTHERTLLPIDAIHRGLVRYFRTHKRPDDFFNTQTLNKFCIEFKNWYLSTFEARHQYIRVEKRSKATALTTADGTPKESVLRSNVGNRWDNSKKTPDTYLWDALVFDSDIEETTTRESLSDGFKGKIEVWGKLPRRALKIPLFDGSSTTPDFVYVLRKEDGTNSINLVIESKGYDLEEDKRGSEKKAIQGGQKFFEVMRKEADLDIHYRNQVNSDDIIPLIEAMLTKE